MTTDNISGVRRQLRMAEDRMAVLANDFEQPDTNDWVRNIIIIQMRWLGEERDFLQRLLIDEGVNHDNSIPE